MENSIFFTKNFVPSSSRAHHSSNRAGLSGTARARSRTAMLTPLAKLAVLLSAAISLSSLLPSATAAVALMCHDDAACDLFAYRSGDCHQCNCCPRCWYVAKGREEIDMRDISSLGPTLFLHTWESTDLSLYSL